jgi:hypothetical protein
MAGQFVMFLLSNYFKDTGCINTSNSVLQHTLAKSHSSKIYGHVPLVPHISPTSQPTWGSYASACRLLSSSPEGCISSFHDENRTRQCISTWRNQTCGQDFPGSTADRQKDIVISTSKSMYKQGNAFIILVVCSGIILTIVKIKM